MRMFVLNGDENDPSATKSSYRIDVPKDLENKLKEVYPSPDGTWRKTFTHEVVATGCKVTMAGDASAGSTS